MNEHYLVLTYEWRNTAQNLVVMQQKVEQNWKFVWNEVDN